MNNRERRSPVPAQDSDALARARALEPSQSFIVQAPAGSGKTELLIQRYLCLLAEVDEPEQVVAITFTRKATGEMRQRVLQALRDAADDASYEPYEEPTRKAALRVLARDTERGWTLRQSPGRLRIFTIDALCHSIVQRMPVGSRLGSSPQVTEKAQALYARAARAAVHLLSEDGEVSAAVRRALLHLENDTRALVGLLGEMLSRRDQWLRHVDGHVELEQVRASLEQGLERALRDELQARRDLVPDDIVPELLALVRYEESLSNLTALPGCGPEHAQQWIALRDFLQTKNGTWRRQVPSCIPKLEKSARDRYSLLIARLQTEEELRESLRLLKYLPPARYDDEQWEFLKALFVLLPRASQELSRVFREAGTVDFIEVARAAQRALGTPERPTDIALGMGHSIRHLLLDEFQDTSVTQFELLKSLTAGWKPGDGRTLFLVGDPMQSIYRFRQAEVGLFLEVWNGCVPGLALEQLRLKKNFRAQQNLVDWVNSTFPAVFPPEDNIAGAAVTYVPCLGTRPPAMRLGEKVHAFLQMPDEPRQVPDRAEAERVVKIVQEARARSEKGSIAILVRARTHLAAIIPELKKAGITFRAFEIDCLAERPVVMDLLALTRALLHAADRPAWLTVLRAPWCGLTLADMLSLCGAPEPQPGAERNHEQRTVWEQLQHAEQAALSEDGRARMLRVRAVLQAALERSRRLPLRQWVEATWIALGGPACLTSDAELADANQFFELLEQLESGGELADLDEVGERMKELFGAPESGAENPVHIMTIYVAKGLEFDAVIVPGMGKRTAMDDARLFLWEERAHAEGSELLLAPLKPRATREGDPLYDYLSRGENRRGQEEGKRVLYVASTRAREELHLLGCVPIKKDREGGLELGRPEANTLLSYLWPVVEEEFEAEFERLQRQRAAAGPRQLVIPALAAAEALPLHVLHRLPAGWTAPAAPASPAWKPAVEAEPEPEADISFHWVGPTARRVGTVVHLILQRIAREGLERWYAARLRELKPLYRSLLANEGIGPAELDSAAARVLSSLEATLADERGRWTLEPHSEAHSELALSGTVAGRLWRVKIDRTFVDEHGTRWIVDYKTSPHEGGRVEEFLDNEQARYREKLEVYATLLARMEQRPIRIGLYFPLLKAWREWQPDIVADAAPA